MADLTTLVRRLKEVLAPPTSDSPEAVADAIVSYRVGPAVCCRLNERVASFQRVYEHVFQRQLDGKPLKEPKAKKTAK